MAECWSCGAERGDVVFCTTCGKIQPPSDRLDYFAMLGVKPTMDLERSDLESAFRQASKMVHPDRFGAHSSVERKLALQQTEKVNLAYRTLKDALKRAEYLLARAGGEAAGEHSMTRDPAFLAEMLELQESVDAADADGLEALHARVKKRYDARLRGLGAFFDRGEGSLDEASGAIDELRYLRRLLDRIDARLEEMDD